MSEKEKSTKLTKPFLKWIGGKTQIIDAVMSNFPKKIENYHEIFLGGSSVLLAFLSLVKNGFIEINGKIIASDLNPALINTYINIQKDPKTVYDETTVLVNEYNTYTEIKSLHKNKPKHTEKEKIDSKESYYYWVRNCYNNLSNEQKNSPKGTAMFIFMNKTGFRGMFREGPNGFNIPFGNYKNPQIIDRENIFEISDLIKNVVFKCQDFEKSLQNIQKNDFVYLDPPYYPLNKKSFVEYTKDGFDEDKHAKLFKMTRELKSKFLMSNSDVPTVNENFKDMKIETILCKRSINSKNPGSKTMEVLINN